MRAQKGKHIPMVQGPFLRESGERYWACRVDSRLRIRIPNEIFQEQGWQSGDHLELIPIKYKGVLAWEVTNHDAIARGKSIDIKPSAD